MEIIEDLENGTVAINGELIMGFIYYDDHCVQCHNDLIYYERYDAIFCAHCNTWKEKKCDSPTCNYCADRPKKPLRSNK